MAFDNGLFFSLSLKDNLTGALQNASKQGVSALGNLEKAKGNLTNKSGGLIESLGGVSGQLLGMVAPLGIATLGLHSLGEGLMSVIDTGREFTKTMSRVKALSDANVTDYKRLEAAAISLGASTSFSSQQVAEGFIEQFTAGLTVDQSLQSIKGNLNLAAASQVGLSRATEIAIATMHQYGLEAKDNERTVDTLALANNMFATDLEQIADALNYLGPTAHAFGVDLEESLAVYGTLSNAGLRGSLATRALGTSMTRLAAPTKKMSELMQQLNLKFFDAQGKYIGLNNTVGLLNQKFKGFTDEQKQGALATLFGAEAIQEWNILLSKGKDQLVDYTKQLKNSGGTADKMAKTQLNNLDGDVEQFSGAMETARLKMFSSWEGTFRDITQWATRMVNVFSSYWDSFTQPFAEVFDIFSEIKLIFVDLGAEFSDGTSVWSASLKALSYALWWAAQPVKYLAYGIKGLIAGFGAMVTASKTFAEKISSIFMPLGQLLNGVFTLNWNQVKSGWGSLSKNLGNLFSDTGESFTTEFMRLWNLKPKEDGEEQKQLIASKSSELTGNNTLSNIARGNNGVLKTAKESTDDNVSGVRGGRSVIVDINNLISNLTINASGIDDLKLQLKSIVSETMIDAVNDFETSF